MKCEECDGTGKVQKWFYERTGFGKCEKVCGDVKCEWCNGTGEVEQTNEEWFDTLSTEEKADLLFGTFYLAGRNDEKNGVWKGVDTIMEWLKQPHKE